MIKTVIHERYEVLKNLELFKATFDQTRVKTFIIQLNHARLQARGTDINGNVIGRYSVNTEILSGGEKRAGEPYNLKDTGEFYKSWVIKVGNDSLTIDADGQKEFIDWGADEIGAVGLDESNFKSLYLFVIPLLIRNFKDVL